MDTTETTVDDRGIRRSAGLGQFRKNPFRVLRLAASAEAKEAVWQADKALARARVGMQLADPDPTPWLPAADELEIQQAAQTMEGSLARLVEQVLWFDLAGDPRGGELQGALTMGDGPGLARYLEIPFTEMIAMEGPGLVAHRLNQANLRLLLAFSRLHAVGPEVGTASASVAPPPPLAWRSQDGLSIVESPHLALRAADGAGATRWEPLLAEALSRWSALLVDPALTAYLQAQIDRLRDPLLGHDDVEAALGAIRTRLADLVVAETKAEMVAGRVQNVAKLSGVAGRSGIDAEIWMVAFRPLRALFQQQLAELDPSGGADTAASLDDVSVYLGRLEILAERWRGVDQAQLLGLASLIDEAAGVAFGRMRTIDRDAQLTPRFAEVLEQVKRLAVTSSLKERVGAYRERVADFQATLCHFCKKRELDGNYCCSLSSKQETSRERYGNVIRVQYRLGARPVARCQQCAEKHEYLRHVGRVAFYASLAVVILFAILRPFHAFAKTSTGMGIVWLGMGVGSAWLVGVIVRRVVSALIIPKDETSFASYQSSRGYSMMVQDGFHSMKYDYRRNAWELVNTEGVAARHGGGTGDVGSVLLNVFWVALFLLAMAFKVCH
jgi:hypothetical protein